MIGPVVAVMLTMPEAHGRI